LENFLEGVFKRDVRVGMRKRREAIFVSQYDKPATM